MRSEIKQWKLGRVSRPDDKIAQTVRSSVDVRANMSIANAKVFASATLPTARLTIGATFMHKIIETIIKHPVTIIMVTALLFFGGIMGTMNMSMQLIPDIEIPMVSVIVTYPGASAATVEDTVTSKLESELSNVTGVTDVSTFSYDNVSAVMLNFDYGTDLSEKISTVTDKVAKISLPDGCNDPEVSTVDLNGMATATLYVTDTRDVSTPGSVANAAATAHELAGKLLSLDGVGSVQTDGEPTDGVIVTPIKGMESAVLLLVQSLAGGQYDIPLGDITTGDGSVQIRNLSDVKSMDEIRALPVELPASVAASLSSIKSLAEYYEQRTPAEISSFRTAVNDEIKPAINAFDARYPADADGGATDEVKRRLRRDSQLKYYISLLSYPTATLWTLDRSDEYKTLMDNVRDKTDKEIYDLADDAGSVAGFTIGAETLFMAREEANAAAGETKGLAAIVEFKRSHGDFHEYTAADHAALAVAMGLTADAETAGEIVGFIGGYSREGLSGADKRRFFGEPLDDADYARLFYMTDLGNDHPIIATETGMKFVRADSFDANAAFLYDFKVAHPGTEAGYLTDDEVFALYEGLDTKGIIEYDLSRDMVHLIRSTDFGEGGALTVKLSDVAHAVGPGDPGYLPSYEAYAYHNGIQGVKISVFTSNGANGTNVVKAVKGLIGEMTTAGSPFTIALTDDQSEFISDSVVNVLLSMLIGGALAVIVIFLFLKKIKPSIIISVTMPLSVLSALLMLFVMGITLNMVSLGGLAVGIGMLVDNSIVVIEAISKRRDAGDNAFRAAINGTAEVAGALVGSTLTTVCVFIPILFVGGLCAEIFTDLSWAVIWSLTFSLLVAVTVIPALYALVSGDRKLLGGKNLASAPASPDGNATAAGSPVNNNITAETFAQPLTLETPAQGETQSGGGQKKKTRRWKPVIMEGLGKLYAKVLPAVLGKKAIAVVVALVVFGASVGLVFTTGTEFLPSVDKGLIEVDLGYYGTATLDEAETDAAALAGLITTNIKDAESVSVSVGVQGLLAFNNTGTVSIKLKPDASTPTHVVTEQVRTLTDGARRDGLLSHTATATVAEIDGVVESITGGMSALSVTVVGEDLAVLQVISDKIVDELDSQKFKDAGFRTATGSMSEENSTLECDLDFDMTALADKGITYSNVVMTLRAGLAGYTAATVTLGGKDCDVSVSFADGTITSIDELLDFTVGFADGEAVKLRDVAEAEIVTADTVIKKLDGLYTASVSAEVYDLDSGTAGDMMAKAARGVLAGTYGPTGRTFAEMGYEFRSSGVASYLDNAFGGLVIALIVSFFLLFAVMAAQFESVTKPLIIMSSIPFSFTGGFLALVITGTTLNVVSFVGVIMLMGVIVNNAIVLLEKIKQLHDDGMPHYDAVIQGCRTRLRPVLMTTLTTVLALFPLALGLGSGGELMQPLGIVVMGGLTLGTLVTLLLTPSIYCLVKGISKARPNGRKDK